MHISPQKVCDIFYLDFIWSSPRLDLLLTFLMIQMSSQGFSSTSRRLVIACDSVPVLLADSFKCTDNVYPFASSTPGFDAQVAVMRGEEGLQRRHVTLAISELPSTMLANRRFAEVAFTLTKGDKR